MNTEAWKWSVPVKMKHIRASMRALVDEEDYAEVMKYKWWTVKSGTGFYAYRTRSANDVEENGGNKNVPMHRQILQACKGKDVDHINHDKLDNRKVNLRSCTRRENLRNTGMKKSNTTGYKGVKIMRDKFQARLRDNDGKSIHLGTFNTAKEAHDVYKKEAKKIYGEFYNESV